MNRMTNEVRNEAYGWHFQYLTVIGLTLSTLTFIVALLADITLSRRLFLAKNLLSVCSAPMEVLISVLYWGLRVVSKTYHVPFHGELIKTPDRRATSVA